MVDNTVNAIKSVCNIKALVGFFRLLLCLTRTPHLLQSKYVKYEGPERYFKMVLPSPYNKTGRKGIHKTPHFTKLPREFEDMYDFSCFGNDLTFFPFYAHSHNK